MGDAKRHKSCQIILNYDKETNNMSKETKEQTICQKNMMKKQTPCQGKIPNFSNSNPIYITVWFKTRKSNSLLVIFIFLQKSK